MKKGYLFFNRYPLPVPNKIRTRDLLIRSQTLYPAELPAHIVLLQRHIFYDNFFVLSILFLKIFVERENPSNDPHISNVGEGIPDFPRTFSPVKCYVGEGGSSEKRSIQVFSAHISCSRQIMPLISGGNMMR